MKFTLNQNIWQGNEPVEIELPDSWNVEFYGLPNDEFPSLNKEEIRQKINAPYDSKTIYELAQDAQEVCIVFDDLSRGTPTNDIAHIILEELGRAGVTDDHIRFICALGAHCAHNRRDFSAKLGEDIMRRIPIYNHNCYENNDYIGAASGGYEVYCNAEFMSCDLRIGIGAITPHPFNGFSGGYKLLFPGMASIDTIYGTHKAAIDDIHARNIDFVTQMGDIAVDGMRNQVEELGQMIGQFFKIDVLYNSRLEVTDVYAGDAIKEYYAAIPAAQKSYSIPRITGKDIVITNANAKATDAMNAVSVASLAVKESGGDLVLIDRTHTGQQIHYLLGEFGRNRGGRMYSGRIQVRPQISRYIYWMEPEPSSAFQCGELDKQVYVNTWQEAHDLLVETYGKNANVAIIAEGTIACYE